MFFRPISMLALIAFASLGTGCAANGAIKTVQDPFNGPQRAFARYLDDGHFTAVGMSEGGGKFSIQVLTVMRGQARTLGAIGDKSLFKVGDETVTLAASNDAKPVANATQYEIFTQWMVLFAPTREEFLKFAHAPLTAVKLTVGDATFQLPLSSADSELIMKNAAILAGEATAK